MIQRDVLYSAPQIIELTNAPRTLVYEALESGELPAIRRGRRWLIGGSAAIAWVESIGQEPR